MLSNRHYKRLISMFTSVVMVLSLLLPMGVFASPLAVLSTDESLDVLNLDQAHLQITLDGDYFVSPQFIESTFTVIEGPDGLSVSEAVYKDSGTAEIALSFTGSIDADTDFRIQIDGAVLGSGVPLTTNALTIRAVGSDFDFIVTHTEDTPDIHPGDGLCADEAGNCTLRAAINESNALDGPQSIYVPEGRYLITRGPEIQVGAGPDGSDIRIDDETNTDYKIHDDLTIVGDGQNLTIIGPESGSWISRVMQVDPGVSVVLQGIEITGGMETGNVGGGGIRNQGNLTLEHVTVSDNKGYYSGGGIYNEGTLTVKNSRIANNGGQYDEGSYSRVDYGGGIYQAGDDAKLVLEESTITGNFAKNGAGIAVFDGTVEIKNNTTISYNESDSAGGIYIGGGNVTINHSIFEGNHALVGNGGALTIADDADVNVQISRFAGNTAEQDGGAVYVHNFIEGSLIIEDSQFVNNQANRNGEFLAVVDDEYYMDSERDVEFVVRNNEIRRGQSSGYNQLYNSTLTTISAEYNYWGGESPESVIDGNVEFLPWYIDEDMSELGPTNILVDIKLSDGHLIPDFDPFIEGGYTVYVEHDVEQITVTPVPLHTEATIVVNGNLVTDDDQSSDINLEYDWNYISIMVTAPDADTYRLYGISVFRKYAPQIFEVNTELDTIDINPEDEICADEEGRCSLRAAIVQANMTPSHDTIILPAGEYKLTLAEEAVEGVDPYLEGDFPWADLGDLDVLNPLTIRGAGAEITTIDATDIDHRVFVVWTDTFHLSGVTITGGTTDRYEDQSGGGILYHHYSEYVEQDVQGKYSITDSIITRNKAVYGAAILLNEGELSLDNVTVSDNESEYDGNVYIEGGARLVANDSVFSGNETLAYDGGAIFNGGSVELHQTSFINNTAVREGGAILNHGEMTLIGVTIQGNTASAGGGIYNNGDIEILDSKIAGNRASTDPEADEGYSSHAAGGGIYNNGNIEISSSEIADNQAGADDFSVVESFDPDRGGGIYSAGYSTLRIADSYIHGNRSALGAGLYSEFCIECGQSEGEDVESFFSTVISNTTVSHNVAGFYGGGAALATPTYIDNSTFTDNQAGEAGGGIFGLIGIVIDHSTIVDNVLTDLQTPEQGDMEHMMNGGSGLYVGNIYGQVSLESENPTPTAFVANSIISGSGDATACEGPIALLGNNIISGGSCGLMSVSGGDVIDADPLLADLANNGGYTPTRALLPGSPALDAAREINTSDLESLGIPADMLLGWFEVSADQRGIERPQGGASDIGAYEVEWAPYAVLPYYDGLKDELLVRFGSELVTDPEVAPLLEDKFTVFTEADGQQREIDILDLEYGDDGKSVILKLDAMISVGDTVTLTIDANAVRLSDDTYVLQMSDMNVLTAWEVGMHILENAGETELSMIDIGMIVKALSDGSLEQLLEEYQYDFLYDTEVIRRLLALIQPKYVVPVIRPV